MDWLVLFFFFGHDGNTPLHSGFVQLFACGCSIVMVLLPFLGLMLISCFSLLLVGIGTSLLVICILHIPFNHLRFSLWLHEDSKYRQASADGKYEIVVSEGQIMVGHLNCIALAVILSYRLVSVCHCLGHLGWSHWVASVWLHTELFSSIFCIVGTRWSVVSRI